MKKLKEVVWLQITAGQGPKECAWVVAQLCKKILVEAKNCLLTLQLVECLAFDKKLRKQKIFEVDAYRSILLRIEGRNAQAFAGKWKGIIKWRGLSQFRAKEKRSSWYVGIYLIRFPENNKLQIERVFQEIVIQTFRASGPGGQHVNKTDSAVRVKHIPTGTTVRVECERSQHRNRKIAIERLLLLLQTANQRASQLIEHDRWLSHFQVQRGNAKRTFYGLEFDEK